jgi:hypothetical protein
MGFLSRKQKTVESNSPTELAEPYEAEPVDDFDVHRSVSAEPQAGSAPTPPEPDDVEITVSQGPSAGVVEVAEPETEADVALEVGAD